MRLAIKNRTIKIALISAALLALLGLSGFTGLLLWVNHGVREVAERACQTQGMTYPEHKVEALIATVGDARQPFQERNLAVWALGQLGDERALPVLKAQLTGRPVCNHSQAICQYEAKKAMAKITGEKKVIRLAATR